MPKQTTNPEENNQQLSIKTVMALDFGINKMGIALGNTLTQTARPLMQFPMNNGKPHWENLLKIFIEWEIKQVIVGLPFNMDGTISELALRAHKFARRLNNQLKEQQLNCEVILVDERLTSREARQLAWEFDLIRHEHEPIDSIAAAILLGSWLRDGVGEKLA